ncbi:hypothetical protein HMPREF0872_00585 [Veillonella montpellierensis DNF00314]|uniref:TonB-dependent receptor n=1 Tax=Veillonella montpellierensis DNF00314 TaxID=1401067 RepID=A0A096AN68_9FIRM|nr:TonB-dependent receptor [Veillonella montpellierensis]KGF48131.1 hypothetical protein HMPREF0872_00585 [Veillonella montpellierensis DNF00314]
MQKRKVILSLGILCWMSSCCVTYNVSAATTLNAVTVRANKAVEEAKWNSQQVSIITQKDIQDKQAKSVEDIIFNQTGVSRTVDAMGRVGVSIRGAEPRHTLILVDGQQVMGDLSKYSGAADELLRLGTENVERIEVIQGAASAKYGSDAVGGVINVITKKANVAPEIAFNMESLRGKGDRGFVPHSNYYVRADSGRMGNATIGIFGSKRDIMPVYATEKRRHVWGENESFQENFQTNELRYSGNAIQLGAVGSYEFSKNNKMDFNIGHYTEDLSRHVKHTDAEVEPQQIYKRKSERDNYTFNWSDKKGRTAWTIESNYTKMKEDDVALTNYSGRSRYEGKNELKYIDNVDHRQKTIQANFMTDLNDQHVLSYGFGQSIETGEGSRLKASPHRKTMKVNPWDYDKNLMVDSVDNIEGLSNTAANNRKLLWSHIHDYAFNENNVWQQNYEYYGLKDNSKPLVSYNDYVKYGLEKGEISMSKYTGSISGNSGYDTPSKSWFLNNYQPFKEALERENPTLANTSYTNIVGKYFSEGVSHDPRINKTAPIYNGKKFMGEYRERNNQITVGSGEIKKRHIYIGDTWQVSDDTIFTPIIRADWSSLFGLNISGNLGITHMVHGNPHRRLKTNIGTGYTEPGMGELWYNWEMFGSTPIAMGYARMGWWWDGNPNLKPEKSVNYDISLEGENKKTTWRVGIFHNQIKNYMTTYFTGKVKDFAPYLSFTEKWKVAPDLIYSFKNIGKADITGLEFEVTQKLGHYWSTKLGYTWLHAINKSDPTMPHQLLDKPVHKFDININYTNKKSGWNGSLWSNFYINMLDSNSLANSSNYWSMEGLDKQASQIYAHRSDYKKKTFGIWNFILQKQIGKDSLAYIGVNNIFNHHDDDRAIQSRVYRFGINMKFGSGDITSDGNFESPFILSKLSLDDFVASSFDSNKQRGVTLIGDYRARWNAHGGSNRAGVIFRTDTSVATGSKNMYDVDGHSFGQRLRLGIDARMNDTLHVKVVGSASSTSNIDTKLDLDKNKSLNKQRIDKLDVTKHVNHWDFSIGRLTESMGVTGYWFGKEFDGVRAIWTGQNSQIRIGYGSLKGSTGIIDSPYTHILYEKFKRPVTVNELLGIKPDATGTNYDSSYKPLEPSDVIKGADKNINFYKQLRDSVDANEPLEKRADILRRLVTIVNKAYGKEMNKIRIPLALYGDNKIEPVYKIINKKTKKELMVRGLDLNFSTQITSNTTDEDLKFIEKYGDALSIKGSEISALETNKDGKVGWNYLQSANKKASIISAYNELAKHEIRKLWKIYDTDEYRNEMITRAVEKTADGTWKPITVNETWGDYELPKTVTIADLEESIIPPDDWAAGPYKPINSDRLIESIYESSFTGEGSPQGLTIYGSEGRLPQVFLSYLYNLTKVLYSAEDGSKQPRAGLGDAIGLIVKTEGSVMEQDVIPSIHQTVFLQVKHRLNHNLGFNAWYLQSINDDTYTIGAANGKNNDMSKFNHLANVWGIGAKWQFGRSAILSFDYGRNQTNFGRYMNGHSVGYQEADSGDYQAKGHVDGGTPYFWTARLDIGKADINVPRSWNMFVDYKYFQHGSFFGGNGTESLPDRYLDGIRSFTIGTGYVPTKNVLWEMFYTFDAKGTNKRDTLFGPENFSLGDYARVQATYRF